MRKIIVGAFVSLDGVMQAPGGPQEDTSGGFEYGGWTVPYFDEAVGQALDGLFEKPFDLLLGRRTYDIFAAYWPVVAEQTAPGAQGASAAGDGDIAHVFNRVTKYVATHRGDTLAWQNSRSLGDDAVATVRELKQQEGPDLLVQGSSDFVQTLLKHDLVDEFRLLIYPLVLGRGKRLFGEGTLAGSFTLASSTTSPGGVLIATYRRAGGIETGSFALPEADGAQ